MRRLIHRYRFPASLIIALIAMTGVFLGVQRTMAELAVPLITTTNFSPTDFRGVYSYYRVDGSVSRRNDPYDPEASVTSNQLFEAWAVGQNKDKAGANVFDGSIYRFDGQRWRQRTMTSLTRINSSGNQVTAAIGTLGEQNAVTGQYNTGSGNSEIWFAGKQTNYVDGSGSATTTILDYANTSATNPDLNATLPSYLEDTTCSGGNNPAVDNELYAIAAAKGYRTPMLAGGKNGLLLQHTKYYDSITDTKDTWKKLCSPIPSTEHITDIAFGENRTAYITTTTSNTGELDRNCTNAGAQSGHLYKVVGNQVTEVGSASGVCFFGVTVQTTDYPTDSTNGPLANMVYVAASNGLWRLSEKQSAAGFTQIAPSETILHDVSSIPIQQGSSSNLLRNGNFESWESSNPSGEYVNPSVWTLTDEGAGGFSSTGCDGGSNKVGISTKEIQISTEVGSGGSNYALMLEPRPTYSSISDCTNGTNGNTKHSVAAVNTIRLSTIPGIRYKISGEYKVEFPGTVAPNPAATIPQGGIAIGCVGGNVGQATAPDCAFENRTQIRTINQGATDGYIPFEMVVSQENNQYANPIKGATSNPRIGYFGMQLQVSCEATYGAKVWCDNLRVEQVDSPSANSLVGAEITAVGDNGTSIIYSDRNFLSLSSRVESAANTSDPLYAVSAIGQQHAFAVGPSSLLLQRVSGNVSGYVWAGNASPANGGQNAGLGWISTSCLNQRDGNSVSLCQRQIDAYGLTLEDNRLSGRAWFGKNYAAGNSNSDNETIALGSCQGANARDPDLPQPATTYTMTGSCNPATRTCQEDDTRACLRDFDCYGHCEYDQSFICLHDADCTFGSADLPSGASVGSSKLQSLPNTRLQCDENNASSLACAGGGWLSFDANDIGTPPAELEAGSGERNYCDNGGACLDATTGKLQGVGRFMTLANSSDPNGDSSRGWISLRGKPVNTPTPVNIGGTYSLIACQACALSGGDLSCAFCQDGDQRSCQPEAASCTKYCGGDITKNTCTVDSECTANESCKPASFCSSESTNAYDACTNDTQCNGGTCSFTGATCSAAGALCDQYGVNLDTITGQFSGYAWSPDYGWLNFGNVIKGTRRYIQTRLGDVYSQGNIGAPDTLPAPGNLCNASYVVSAGGSINNFCSSLTVDQVATYDTEKNNASFTPFASQKNLFETALGRIDLQGAETVTDSTNKTNKFGQTVTSLGDSGGSIVDAMIGAGNSTTKLQDKVFVAGKAGGTQTYTIDRSFTILNGGLSGSSFVSGAGTLIINGNLRIDKDIVYSLSPSITLLRQLASLMVVVKGNLIIDNGVTELAGNYYVTGTICTGQPDNGDSPPTECTVTRNLPNNFPLTVRGIMLAHKFYFARTFAGTVETPLPSEVIINDGRLQSNPPQGFRDFAGVLPSSVSTGP